MDRIKEKPYLSIIIPAFNEEHRIGVALESLAGYFQGKPISYEVIIVDDGSVDGLARVVAGYASKLNGLRIVRNEINRGKGYAVKRGMQEATGTFRLFMDADNSVDISNLSSFLGELKGAGFGGEADIVIGSVEVPGAYKEDHNQKFRNILGVISKKLIRFLATPGIHDTQRGFKLFTAEAAEAVFSRQTIERWGFDIEVIAIAQLHGFKIAELPVRWVNPKTVSIGLATYAETLVELAKIKMNMWAGKYK